MAARTVQGPLHPGSRSSIAAAASSPLAPGRIDSIVCGVGPLDTLPGRVIGAEPAAVCRWIFTLPGAGPGDSPDDLFPGSSASLNRE